MRALIRLPLGLLLLLSAAALRAADRVGVAAAANLTYVLEPLDAAFVQANPGVEVVPVLGASGNLVAQIKAGAPLDVFLSADMDFPRKLIAAKGAQASSLVAFAVGKLVLWTLSPDVDASSIESAVRSPAVHKLAVANPKTAPYGKAAEDALAKLGLADEARPKVVYGENITQTAQFVSSGNADAGFVALSLVMSPKLKDKGRWIEVPANLHAPIEQGAVLTSRGASNPAAWRYIDFLSSPAARKIFAQFGYDLP